MSFAAPLVLVALVVLPLLAFLYYGHERQRRAGAAAFVSPRLQPAVLARRPGWRRHAPMLAFALAIGVLIVAAAKPQRTVAVPVDHASIMLATDVSGSMVSTDVKPTRLAAAQAAARKFASSVPGRVNVGVMQFNQTPSVLASPTTDRDAVKAAIARMHTSGSTAAGEAIHAATNVLRPKGKRQIPAAIVLLSDGKTTRGRDPVTAAQAAKKLHVPIYTVSLGTASGTITVPLKNGGTRVVPVPPDPQALAQIAKASGGQSFTARSTAGLKAVYEKLGSQLSHRKEKRQITTVFAGGGLVLLLAGAAMSLTWFGRLV